MHADEHSWKEQTTPRTWPSGTSRRTRAGSRSATRWRRCSAGSTATGGTPRAPSYASRVARWLPWRLGRKSLKTATPRRVSPQPARARRSRSSSRSPTRRQRGVAHERCLPVVRERFYRPRPPQATPVQPTVTDIAVSGAGNDRAWTRRETFEVHVTLNVHWGDGHGSVRLGSRHELSPTPSAAARVSPVHARSRGQPRRTRRRRQPERHPVLPHQTPRG